MTGGEVYEMRQDHMRVGVADAERLLDACGAVLDSAKTTDSIATLATKEKEGE